MNQLVLDTQIRSLIRLTMIKLNQYNDNSPSYQHQFKKMLGFSETIQYSISKILKLETKNDYQHLILMTFIGELISIFIVFADTSRSLYAKITPLMDDKIIDLIGYSSLSKEVQNYYYLKKMETIRVVFQYKLSIPELNLPLFSKLYNFLRNCQTTDSNTTKEHYKVTFVNIHKHLLTHSKNPDVLDLIFSSLVNDSLVAVEEFKKDETEGMRILDSRLLAILFYLGQSKITPKQLAMVTYLLIKVSQIENSYIIGLSASVNQALLNLLTNIESPLIVIVIHHVILNPLIKLLTTKASPNQQLQASLLFNQIQYIFKQKRLLFSVLKLSDINIYSQSLIQKLLTQLHSYVDQEEKKITNDGILKMVKECLKNIMMYVKNILDNRKETGLSEEAEKFLKFYRIKEKTYLELVDKFNNEPKSLIKGELLSDYKLDLLAHFLRRSPKIKVQKMIQCLGQPSENSGRLLSAYLSTFNFKKFSIEESLRVMLSNFFLIGESQQINRVSEQLSNFLYENDRQKYQHSDNVYVFCSALLILNTDLHNPQNQKKMTQPEWLKMCNTIKGVSSQELLVIHQNISKNKIQNFRDISHLQNINYTCFMYNFHTDREIWNLSYVDPQLKVLESNTQLFKYMSYDFLETILVGKQITKLDKLIDVWEYKEDVYECEILETMKTLVSRGQIEVPENAVRRMLSKVELNSTDVNPKALSYYWLMSKIIIQHPDTIATEIICTIINNTYMMRLHLEDDLSCRELIKVRRIKDSLKWFKSKSIKKKGSILDIFANFLGEKESSDEQGTVRSNIKRPMTFKKLGAELYEILGSNRQSREEGIQYFLTKIQDQKTKIPVGQFIFTLYILFDLVCLSSNLESIHSIQQLLNQILLVEDSLLGKRLHQLQRRKEKKYDLIIFLTKYYTLKILLENPFERLKSAGLMESAVSILQECNTDLLRQFIIKAQSLKTAMKEEYFKNDLLRRVEDGVTKNIRDNGNKQQFQKILENQESAPEQASQPVTQQVTQQIPQQVPEKGPQEAINKQQLKQVVQEIPSEIKQQTKVVDQEKGEQGDRVQIVEQQRKQERVQSNQGVDGEQKREIKGEAPPVHQQLTINQESNGESAMDHGITVINQDTQHPQPLESNKQEEVKQEQPNKQTVLEGEVIEKQQPLENQRVDGEREWQNIFSLPKKQLIESGNSLPLPQFLQFKQYQQQLQKNLQSYIQQNKQDGQTEPIKESSDIREGEQNLLQKENEFISQQQLLKTEEQELNKLMSGLSEQHLEKLGLPIYML